MFFVSLFRGPDGMMTTHELAVLMAKADAGLVISPVYKKTGIPVWHLIGVHSRVLLGVIIKRRSA
jgi:hypothetical protein